MRTDKGEGYLAKESGVNHEGSSFLSGCAPANWFVFFAKESDEMARSDQANSTFFAYDEQDEDTFTKYDMSVAWPAIAMATVKPTSTGRRDVVAVGPHGDWWEVESATTDEFAGSITSLRGTLRSLAAVGDSIFGCGMARTVVERMGRDRWFEFGPSDDDSASGSGVIGFEDLAGFDRDDIYCVGWNGEIWHFSGSSWHRIDSPVSSILSAVCCADDGCVYAVGHDGVLVKGRGARWEVVETARSDNLTDVQVMDGVVYVATNFEVLRLGPQGLAPDTDFHGTDRPGTCLHLLKGPGGLFSMGTKDLWLKRDGAWQQII